MFKDTEQGGCGRYLPTSTKRHDFEAKVVPPSSFGLTHFPPAEVVVSPVPTNSIGSLQNLAGRHCPLSNTVVGSHVKHGSFALPPRSHRVHLLVQNNHRDVRNIRVYCACRIGVLVEKKAIAMKQLLRRRNMNTHYIHLWSYIACDVHRTGWQMEVGERNMIVRRETARAIEKGQFCVCNRNVYGNNAHLVSLQVHS